MMNLKYFANLGNLQKEFYELKGAAKYGSVSGFAFSTEFQNLETDYCCFNQHELDWWVLGEAPEWADRSWTAEQTAEELDKRMDAQLKIEYDRYAKLMNQPA